MAYYPPILKITDGTTENTVDLLNGAAGYLLCDWSPVRPGISYDQNVDASSGMKRPVGSRFEAPIDSFTVSLRDTTVGKVIAHERKLNRVLRNASRFWTNQNDIERPYYIMARAKDEQNMRYALIFTASMHNSGNPYAQPFATNAKLKSEVDITFSVEHDFWSPDVPFATRNGEALSYLDYPYAVDTIIGYHEDNFYSGNALSDTPAWSNGGTAGFVAAANHGASTEFTSIRRTDGTELLNTSLTNAPIFNDTDWVYFFADYTQTHKFNNIVLIPGKNATGSTGTFTAEYYTISGWQSLTIKDSTDGMKKPGTISWLSPRDESTIITMGEPRSWVIRVKRTGGTASSTIAQCLPYPAAWNHIEIPESAKGDAGVRLDMRIGQQSWNNDDSNYHTTFVPNGPANKILIGGTRKPLVSMISPGYNTHPYSTNAVFTLPPEVHSWTYGFQPVDLTPYRVVATANRTPGSFQMIGSYAAAAQVQLRNGSRMYSGNFRAFFRMRPTAYNGSDVLITWHNGVTISMRGRVGYRNGTESPSTGINRTDSVEWFHYGPEKSIEDPRSRVYVYDMGVVTLGDPSYIGSGIIDMYQTIELQVKYDTPEGSGIRFDVVDLVLIPVDEFFMEISVPRTVTDAESVQDLIINSASSLGTLNGHVAEFDGSYFDRAQGKRANLSYPVGRPVWLDGDGPTYLHFFSFMDNGNDAESVLSDTFPIDIATSPLYLSAIGNEL